MLAAAMLAGLMGCGATPAQTGASMPGAAPATGIATGITHIALERDCSGCPSGTVLVLDSSGSATLTRSGKARLGTTPSTSQGRVAVHEFEALAQLAVSQGFFALNDVYADPQVQDGAWATLTITRNGQDKAVFRREDAAPPGLKAVEAAVDAVQARIQFAPAGR